jgi:hypothetical protein
MTRQESSKPASDNDKHLKQNREPVQLTRRLDKNLVTYTLAASAAGVGMMALTQAAEARVIATPANIVVPINGGLVQFDINGDGVPDFGLSATTFVQTFGTGAKRHPSQPPLGGIFGGKLNAVPAQTANEVALNGMYGTKPCAAAMAAGARIGPSLPFGAGNVLMAGILGTGCAGSSFAYCHWKGSHPPHAFLAVKFTDTAGSVHFGWVRITAQQSLTTHFNATITGYAYETVPNMPIFAGVTHGPVKDASLIDPRILAPKAPEAASLGMLALGAPGLSAWRRQGEDGIAP